MCLILGVFIMFNALVHCGYGYITCYHCHQTSGECNNARGILDTTNCSTNKCFVLKYETAMPGVNVLATYRGCYNLPEEKIMQNVMTHNVTVTKLHFRWCNSTLCNTAARVTFFYNLLFNLIIYFVTKFFS